MSWTRIKDRDIKSESHWKEKGRNREEKVYALGTLLFTSGVWCGNCELQTTEFYLTLRK